MIGLGGFLGNSLVVIVIRRLRRYGLRSSAHTFILNLAWSDLLVCCICIPLTIAVNFITLQADSVSSKALCKILRFLREREKERERERGRELRERERGRELSKREKEREREREN